MLEKAMRINTLYDFYQGLLTEKQKTYMDLYYGNDYSLSEIADYFKVSRQAVHDNLHRTEEILENFETKLGLAAKYNKRRQLYREILVRLDEQPVPTGAVQALLEDLEQLD